MNADGRCEDVLLALGMVDVDLLGSRTLNDVQLTKRL